VFRTAAATALLATSLVLTGGSATAAEDPPTKGELDQVAPLVQPSIVYETVTWKGYVWDVDNSKYLGNGDNAKEFTVRTQCTGFVVNPDGWIGTAGHCVDVRSGKEAIIEAAATWAVNTGWYKAGTTVDQLVKHQNYRVNTFDENDKLKRNNIDRTILTAWGASVSGVEVAKSKPARIIGFQKYELGDAALLKVDEKDLNAIPLTDGAEPDINDNVVAVGYPAVIDGYTDPDLTPTFNQGTISSKKTVAKGLLPVLQLSASLSGGMSGGPTVDYSGEVVGVNSSRFIGEPFNYAVTADRIRELLSGSGVKNELSPTTQQYRAGIKAFFAGDKKTAVKDLTAVLEEQPANGMATSYLKKAKALPDPKKPASKDDGGGLSSTLLFVGIGVVVLLALLGGLLALLLRRRSRPTPGAPQPGMASPPPAYPGAGVPANAGYPVAETRPLVTADQGAGAPEPLPGGREPVDTRASTPAGFAPMGTATQPPAPAAPAATEPVVSVSSVVDPTPEHKFCTECGTRSAAGVKFCGECGHRL
jgi:serine protease Do